MKATPSAVEEKHLQVDLGEVSLHWTEAGEGPPVLLLHGLNDSHRTWREIWPRLSGRRILMLDLPGHGMSSRPDAPYTLDWNATQVARWIEQMDLRELDVVGHSYGGGVAQWLLLKCRARIRRLGLLSSGGLGREVYPWLRLASIPFLIEAFGQRWMGPLAGFAMARATTSDAKAEIELLASYLRQPGSARAFSRTVRDVIRWRGQTRNLSTESPTSPSCRPCASSGGRATLSSPFRRGLPPPPCWKTASWSASRIAVTSSTGRNRRGSPARFEPSSMPVARRRSM